MVDLIKNARQPMFDICLSDEVRRVRAEMQSRKKTAGFGTGPDFEAESESVIQRRKTSMSLNGKRGGMMIGELSIINEWIPEQMEPGTVFVLENAGEVGEKEDPYWAVLSCPSCGTLGLITRKQMAGLLPTICGLRICSAQFFIKDEEITPRKPF